MSGDLLTSYHGTVVLKPLSGQPRTGGGVRTVSTVTLNSGPGGKTARLQLHNDFKRDYEHFGVKVLGWGTLKGFTAAMHRRRAGSGSGTRGKVSLSQPDGDEEEEEEAEYVCVKKTEGKVGQSERFYLCDATVDCEFKDDVTNHARQ